MPERALLAEPPRLRVAHWHKLLGTYVTDHIRVRRVVHAGGVLGALKRLRSELGRRHLGSITHDDLAAFLRRLDDGTRRANSLRRILTGLRALFRDAVRERWIAHDPTVDLERTVGLVGERDGLVEPYTEEEAAELLEQTESDPILGPWLRILRWTGCRPSDARYVLVEDRRRTEGGVVIGLPWTKNGPNARRERDPAKLVRRAVWEHPELTAYLDRCPLVAGQPIVHDPLRGRCALDHGRYVPIHVLHGRRLRLSGQPHTVYPYRFRHLFATEWLRKGGDVYPLAKVMGTSVKMIEKHYGHILPADTRAMMERMG